MAAEVIVCSFHTRDAYYAAHGERLRRELDRLGVAHEVRAIDIPEGQDWADVCRKKVGFLAEVCEAHPDARVFWVDADCSLRDLPGWVTESSADLIGFQRGFGSPLGIGYQRRTRFWEPCFFGIAPSKAGRQFIRDAAGLERVSTLKATDDYFFEEAWRANAAHLSFQVIPSTAVVSTSVAPADGVAPFLVFGSSGHVDEFKGKVAQHDAVGGHQVSLGRRLARSGLRAAKFAERRLPSRAARPLRRLSDSTGITGVLTGQGPAAAPDAVPDSPRRQALLASMVARAQEGDLVGFAERRQELESTTVVTPRERATVRAAESFALYATQGQGEALPLAWWPRPFPGNFGDWLSPAIVQHATGRPVVFQPPTAASAQRHLVSLGSIGRFAKKTSVVVGTGVSTLDVDLAARATWVSVRGPLTAQALRASGGPDIDRWGDPGVLVRRAIPLTRGATNGRTALVRHYTHAGVPLDLDDDVDELSVLASHPDDLHALLAALIGYDRVVTSAMHVMIACHSYGIPCALVTFEGLEDAVHGSGIKYEDYALGVGISGIREPRVVPRDLRGARWDDLTLDVVLSDEVLDDVAEALRSAAGVLSSHVAS